MAQYGYNEIAEKETNPLLKFLTYLRCPIPWMIEAVVVLSALVQHWPDSFIILVLLLVKVVVGFWEEYQAGNAIAALKAKLAIQAQAVGTQILATLIAVYGFFMAPIGWRWALSVWGDTLAWFAINDRAKLVAYRIFDRAAAPLLSLPRAR